MGCRFFRWRWIHHLPGTLCPVLMLWLLAHAPPGLGRRATPVVRR